MRKKPKFYRSGWSKVKNLGKKIKKKRKWRKACGRDNKRRLKERGYAKIPGIGYGKSRTERGKVKGINFVRVENLKDLEGIKEKGIIIGSVGKKKSKEIIKKANELGVKILNKYKEKNATG